MGLMGPVRVSQLVISVAHFLTSFSASILHNVIDQGKDFMENQKYKYKAAGVTIFFIIMWRHYYYSVFVFPKIAL